MAQRKSRYATVDVIRTHLRHWTRLNPTRFYLMGAHASTQSSFGTLLLDFYPQCRGEVTCGGVVRGKSENYLDFSALKFARQDIYSSMFPPLVPQGGQGGRSRPSSPGNPPGTFGPLAKRPLSLSLMVAWQRPL